MAPTRRFARACSSIATSPARGGSISSFATRSTHRSTSARSSRRRRSSSSSGISSITMPRTTSSPTSRRARAACAICRPSSGSRVRPASGARGASSRATALMTMAEARAVSRQERHDQRPARPPALSRRPPRGSAGVRSADGARARARPRRHAGEARERAADAALLPRREARAADERRSCCRTCTRGCIRRRCTPLADRRRLPARRRAARRRRRRCSSASPARCSTRS